MRYSCYPTLPVKTPRPLGPRVGLTPQSRQRQRRVGTLRSWRWVTGAKAETQGAFGAFVQHVFFFGVLGPVSSFCWCSPFLQVVGSSLFLGAKTPYLEHYGTTKRHTKSNTPRRTQYYHRCFLCLYVFVVKGFRFDFSDYVFFFKMHDAFITIQLLQRDLDWFPDGVHVFSPRKGHKNGSFDEVTLKNLDKTSTF